jgi:hypothetical protein
MWLQDKKEPKGSKIPGLGEYRDQGQEPAEEI